MLELAENYDKGTPDVDIARRNWFGRCVYESDNDVCDEQVVTITWDDDPLPSQTGPGIASIADPLHGRGHKTAPLSFDPGVHPLDGYIDIEPFGEGLVAGVSAPHLKIRIGGELRTSFALAVTARG